MQVTAHSLKEGALWPHLQELAFAATGIIQGGKKGNKKIREALYAAAAGEDTIFAVFTRLASVLVVTAFSVTAPTTVMAQDMNVIEFRQTAQAPDCSTGEVYVNGKLIALFSASPDLVSSRLKDNPFVGDSLTSAVYQNLSSSMGAKMRGADLVAENAGKTIRLIALDNDSYWNYSRPRKKIRALPDDVILIGTRVLNRQCKIESVSDDPYFIYGSSRSSASLILSEAVFSGKLNGASYNPGMKVPVVAVITDASSSVFIKAGDLVLSRQGPLAKAEDIGPDSQCLTRLEHGTNTIIHAGGVKSYERRDDSWFCTDYDLKDGQGPSAIELHRTIDYIEFLSFKQCGAVLGLRLDRTYVISRNGDGSGATAWTRCFANETLQKVADSSEIVFDSQ